MNICIISSSLNPQSKSHLLARSAEKKIDEAGHRTELVKLTEYNLPLCDGVAAYRAADAKKLKSHIESSDALILVTPIYNFDGNAALKNVIELTGSAWNDKPVALMCSAGGACSYMALMPLANSLMLDFRCVIVPRFVYAIESDFNTDKTAIVNPDIDRRIDQAVKSLIYMGR